MRKKETGMATINRLSVDLVHLFECIIRHICLLFKNNIVAVMLSIMLDMLLIIISVFC